MPTELILAIALTRPFCLLSALVPILVVLRRARHASGSLVAARRATSAGLANVLLAQIELFRRFAFLEYSTGQHMYSEADHEPRTCNTQTKHSFSSACKRMA